jgi:hypothetical protein
MNSFQNSSNVFLNSNNPHQIIQRENTYSLSKKYLTVHANDRDTTYYPNSNEFSIKCPQSYTNVQSIRLTEISFPNPINNFSEKLNNNQFHIDISNGDLSGVLEIPNGCYSGSQLSNTLTYLIQKKFPNDASFISVYNPMESKFLLLNNQKFSITHHDNTNCKEPLNNYSLSSNTGKLDRGFLYNIGFDLSGNKPLGSHDMSFANYFTENPNYTNTQYQACKSQSTTKFRNKQPIYMEIDKCNVYDELNPYPNGSNNLYNNNNNSSTNTAFIKISPSPELLTNFEYNKSFEQLSNVMVFFDPPLQRLQNLKFKFRYHDGCLVDLGRQDVNFTLEINELRNEIPKHLNIRTAAL